MGTGQRSHVLNLKGKINYILINLTADSEFYEL